MRFEGPGQYLGKSYTNRVEGRTIPGEFQGTVDLRGADFVVRLLAHWVLSALCLLLVARFVPGISVQGFGTALLAALVIGFINVTLGLFLKILTFPITILTFGIFWLVINGFMLKLASLLAPGFVVRGWWPAFWGGLVLSLLNMVVRHVLRNSAQ